MENRIIFGRFEAISILVMLIISQLLLNLPRILMETAGTAAWILAVYISIITFLIFWIITRLYRRFEGMDLLDISEYIGGSILRIVTGIIAILFFISVTFSTLRQFSESLKIISLPVSPISFIILFFVTGMIVAAYLGIEPIVRLSAIVHPIVFVSLIFIFIASALHFDIANITPIFGDGLYEIFIKGFPKISIYAGIFILFFLAPFIKTNKNFKIVGYATIAISSILIISGVLAYSLTFQYPMGMESFLPLYKLSRLISYSRFFQRIEAIFILAWSINVMLYLGMILFLIVYIFKKTFRLEYYKPVIMPFVVIIYILSLLPSNIVGIIELETKYIRDYAWIVTFLYPAVLLLVAKVRKGKKQSGVRAG